MSRDKQIDEMARTMCFQRESCPAKSCIKVNCEKTWLAEALYNAGYRKKSDVALEVIREVVNIFKITNTLKRFDSRFGRERWSFDKEKYKKGIAELKKKYESEVK